MNFKRRKVVAYKNYFLDFYEKQNDEVQAKIEKAITIMKEYHHENKR